jgi:carbon-monoxide dehydrogenase iron sulfur subunit
MACPFGVLRFHEDRVAPPRKVVAVKCDNCDQRQAKGLIPACVEVCKAGALTFEEPDSAAKRQTDQVSAAMLSQEETAPSPGFALLNQVKKSLNAINRP